MNVQVSRESHDLLVETVEDAIEYACDRAYANGDPISGQTAYTILLCRIQARLAEFEGLIKPTL